MASISWRLGSMIAAVTLMASGAVGSSAAQSPKTAFGTAYDLLLALYPELDARAAYVQVSLDDWEPLSTLRREFTRFDVAVGWRDDPRNPSRPIKMMLGLSVDLDYDGSLKRVLASGVFVNSDQRKSIEARFVNGDDVPRATVNQALRSAGARFDWDSEEAVRELGADLGTRLEPIIGRSTVLSVRFDPSQDLLWWIDLVCQNGEQQHVYRLSLEPFDGRVIAFSRH